MAATAGPSAGMRAYFALPDLNPLHHQGAHDLARMARLTARSNRYDAKCALYDGRATFRDHMIAAADRAEGLARLMECAPVEVDYLELRRLVADALKTIRGAR